MVASRLARHVFLVATNLLFCRSEYKGLPQIKKMQDGTCSMHRLLTDLGCGCCTQKRQMSISLQGQGLIGKVQHMSPERSHRTSIYNILFKNYEVKKNWLHFILTCPCYSVIIHLSNINELYSYYMVRAEGCLHVIKHNSLLVSTCNV